MGLRLRRIARSRIVVWTLALVVGWSTAAVVARAREEGRSWGRRREVVVAKRSVPAGGAVRRADLVSRSVPFAVVPVGAVQSTGAVAGRVLRVPLYAGQIIVMAQIGGPRLSPARALVGAGRRGMAIATGEARPPLRIGDRVDVIAGRGAADGPGPDGVVARDAEVIAVADRSVTVAVDESVAAELARAMASGPLLLALRGG